MLSFVMPEPDLQLDQALDRERTRLWRFIRKRLPTRQDAEDVLQDVLYELVAAEERAQLRGAVTVR
jgi:DNA-directed RNA polymerase specialized sigma24 family protein